MKNNITIISGHYGSGKTEIAINLALLNGKGSTIVDLDIVNPYFRVNDLKEFLNTKKINVISPNYANTNFDLPSLPSSIMSVFTSKTSTIIDLGGDDDGALVLGRYNELFKNLKYKMIFVINLSRKETNSEQKIIDMIQKIEISSKLRVTHLVNNTHLKEFTTKDLITESAKIVDKVSKYANIPFLYTTVTKMFYDEDKKGFMPINLYLKTPF